MLSGIVFVSSSIEYTRSILALAERLQLRGVPVSWISHRESERRWLLAKGVIRLGARHRSGVSSTWTTNPMRGLARGAGTPGGENKRHHMDRPRAAQEAARLAIGYLANVQRRLSAFLGERKVEYVSGGREPHCSY